MFFFSSKSPGPRAAKGVIFFAAFFCFCIAAQAQLIINEVSQGASGSKEYVELLTVGTPSCASVPCVDLRGWIIDDNNGNHATGAGTGIASGCIRFTNDPFWSCIPIGTIILVYNDADLNPSVPAQDLSMSDGNCRLVIPISNCTLFEKHNSQPSTAVATYPTTGFTPCGNWTVISMANTDDSFQALDPSANLVHSVSWGNNTLNDIIYFAGSSAGMVAYMSNAVDNNPFNQANWTRAAVAGNETPGAPNNAANATWITTMNQNCSAITPLNVTAAPGANACGCNGTASASASGSIGPYTYSWAPSGGNAATATGLCAGNYTVTVTSATGCVETASVTVTAPPSLTLTITSSNVSCNGANDGSASVNASGGSGTYTYAWSPSGGNGATANGLPPGSYTVSVTDAGGCNSTITVNITQPAPLSAISAQTDVACNGAATGSAFVSPSGGTGSYTYNWSPAGGNNSSATNLTAGTYTCTITDGNGCSTTATFNLTQPPALTATQAQVDVNCNSATTGSATVNASGGTPGYTYAWSPTGGNNSSAINLAAGNYTCTITDANGCTSNVSFTLTQPTAINSSVTSSPAACGGNNGSATVSASGGTPGYSYNWSPAGGNAATANNLPTGNYTCTITDANGCTSTATVNVGNTPGPTLAIASFSNILCFGGNTGSATANVTGGTPSFSYQWAPSGGTNATATGLSAGSYTCTVTDANGCTSATSVTLTEPPQLTATASASGANCNASDGSATVSVSGGTPGYSYSWMPAGGNAATTTGIPAGNYTCTITDANGCVTNASTTVNNLSGPSATLASATNIACFGASTGTAAVNASGGVGPYSFVWSPAGGTNDTATSLAAGTYTCTVTDNNGCLSSVSVTLTQPTQLSVTTTSTPAMCTGANGSASANTSGGTGTYSYNWSPAGGNSSTANNLAAGNYTVTVTDSNGCSATQSVVVTQQNLTITATATSTNASCSGSLNGTATVSPQNGNSPYTYQWSSGGTNATENGLAAGTYTCTITDASGCTGTQTVVITAPPQLTANATSGSVNCNGGNNGSVSVSANGGTPGYSYAWLPSGGNNSSANGLTVGNYTCTITDANGCIITATASVTQPSAITVSAVNTNELCNGGANAIASVTANGGTPGYTYAWSPSGGNNSSAANLAAGNYTCTITDANGCAVTQTVAITQPPSLGLLVTGDNICAGEQGQISASGNGGVGPYTYLWSNGATTPSLTVTTTTSETFTVIVTDANGCTMAGPVGLTVVPAPVAAISSNAPNNFLNLAAGTQLCFSDASSGATSWSWDLNGTGTSTQQSPCVTLTSADSGQFCATLIVANAAGCADTSDICITIGNEFLSIPNVFTPNADGTNDFFLIATEGIAELHVDIYDRWGVLINSIAAPGESWDGKTMNGAEATDGTYYYVLNATGRDGKIYNASGFLTLLR